MAEEDNTQTASEPASPKRGRPRRRPPSPQIHVVIDQEKITNSVRRDSRHCMIAEAIQAAAPDLSSVTVDLASIRFTDPKRRLRFAYMTPRTAQSALIDFDQGVQPEPFEFWLRRPSNITRNHPSTPRTNSEKSDRAVRRQAANARHQIIKDTRATVDDAPFQPPAAYVEKVIAAMDDPEANLGPAIMVPPPHGNAQAATPITIGGNPPRRHGRGNIIRTRVFGLRELKP